MALRSSATTDSLSFAGGNPFRTLHPWLFKARGFLLSKKISPSRSPGIFTINEENIRRCGSLRIQTPVYSQKHNLAFHFPPLLKNIFESLANPLHKKFTRWSTSLTRLHHGSQNITTISINKHLKISISIKLYHHKNLMFKVLYLFFGKPSKLC